MAKLTKRERKLHEEAATLLSKQVLNEDEREFVFQNWQPGSICDVGAYSAHFTPFDLAKDFRIDAGSGRILDLCAGIGVLAYWCKYFTWDNHDSLAELVCVERNPHFVAIGKKLVPDAQWFCADVFDVSTLNLGHFDNVISNPPFSNFKRTGKAPRYSGSNFAYHVMDIASDMADAGAFIIPQNDAPFRYSGAPYYDRRESKAYTSFEEQTGISMEAGCSIDTSIFRDQWQHVAPAVEIVCTDFTEAREPKQYSLFDEAA